MPPRRNRKLVLMGFRAVGKSTICLRFVDNQFSDSYDPTIENTFLKTIRHPKNVEYDLEIVDSAGQDEFSIFQKQYTVGIHGYILVYCVNDQQSFEMCTVINDKILNALGADKVPRILVGNKADLEDQRLVSTQQGKALAKELGCAFVECSAKLNQNITEVFTGLLDEIEKDQEPPPKDSGCSLM